VRETHPEVCFWALNGKTPILSSKKTEEGAAQRLALLQRAYPRSRELLERASAKHRKDCVCRDDILDALVAAPCRLGDLASLPVNAERDGVGLPMEIVFPEVQP
jgi:predicted RNase H-like nuclease